MQLVVTRPIRYETSPPTISNVNVPPSFPPGAVYLSSGPPSFLAMFLKEKIVPKTNFASSSTLRPFNCDCASGTPFAWDVFEEDVC